ncbi:MAG: site-2 protease family protein [Deltaproteobacteria bacterium]|nr:site-2 protease family protein [Deltaproteobacteria bacterium]
MIEHLIFNLATTLVPLILAIAVHEWAHVAAARFLGDRTGEEQGRLTLNPLAHIDPIWTVGLPAFLVVSSTLGGAAAAVIPFFAAGKPAPYNPLRFSRQFGGKRVTMRTGELLVAGAGPASNIALAVVTTAVLFVLVRSGAALGDPRSVAHLVFGFILLNVGLAAFNLLPIPPLDGSKVLMSLLPRPAAAKYEAVASQLSWVLLMLLIFGGARYVLSPIQRAAVDLVLRVVG